MPMLTLSWLCDSVLRLNTLAGMVSFSASAVSADAVICMRLEAVVRDRAPRRPAPTRFAGRPWLVAGLHSSASWRSSRSATFATAVLSAVHRERDVAAVEVAAVQDLVASRRR